MLPYKSHFLVLIVSVQLMSASAQSLSDVTIHTGLNMYHITNVGLSPKIGAGIVIKTGSDAMNIEFVTSYSIEKFESEWGGFYQSIISYIEFGTIIHTQHLLQNQLLVAFSRNEKTPNFRLGPVVDILLYERLDYTLNEPARSNPKDSESGSADSFIGISLLFGISQRLSPRFTFSEEIIIGLNQRYSKPVYPHSGTTSDDGIWGLSRSRHLISLGLIYNIPINKNRE